jgi:hypothetical protein
MRTAKIKITRQVMVTGQARAAGEVVEVTTGQALLLLGLGKAVPAPDVEPGPAPEPKPRRRARAATGRFQGDDLATPEVNEAWADV